MVLARKVHKVVILGANQEWDGSLIETTALAIPLLDRVEGALASEVEHEQNGHGVIANQGQHVDKLALAT